MSTLDQGKSVWLIWENIPEETIIYFLPAHILGDAEYDVLNSCHNNFLGCVGAPDVDINKLSEWLDSDGKFAHCKVETLDQPPETLKPTKVVVTGFLM